VPPRPHGACPAWAGARRTGSAPLTRAQARRQGLDVASLVQEPAQSGRGCPRRRKALIQLTSTAPGRKQGCSATTSAAARRRPQHRRTRASSPTTSRRGLELMTRPRRTSSISIWLLEPSSTARRSRPSSSPTSVRPSTSGRPSSPSTRGAGVRPRRLTSRETCGGNPRGRGRRRPSPLLNIERSGGRRPIGELR